MIIIAGSIDFASQEDRDAAVADAVQFQESTRADEPGCVEYSFAPDSGCPTRVQVFELWADEASLAAHFEHPNFTAMGGVLRRTGRATSSMAKYRTDLSEPVKDPEGRYRADFFTA
jgi:quinol monooxygenase YgiN